MKMKTLKSMWGHKALYLILLPGLAWYVIFCYLPMFNTSSGGILLAFKEFRNNMPFSEMQWVGLKWFERLMNKPDFWIALTNTFKISFLRLIFEFPMPVVIAILLNEVRRYKPKRIFQTILTFPNFLSWVLVLGVLRDLLQVSGLLNGLRVAMGADPVNYLNNSDWLSNMLMVLLTNVWKSAGWGSIIYLASISGIDPSLYEAATIDGAGRWKCILHVTWPGIRSTAVVLLVLSCGNILNAGFDQLFNLRAALNIEHLDILDTYIYRYAFGMGKMNFGFTVAAGLFKSVVNFALLLTANKAAGWLSGETVF